MSDRQMSQASRPRVNALEGIRADPDAKHFEVEDVLFAQFECPEDEVGIWMQTDALLHVLSGVLTWRIAAGTGSAGPGDTVFFKKGAYSLRTNSSEELCIQMYFIPDRFVRHAILQLTTALPALPAHVPQSEVVTRVMPETTLSAFLEAMRIYFAADEKPPEALLKLKLTELLTSILLSRSNLALSVYLQSLTTSDSPSIDAIMEANYHHNLPLEAFAQMCHRSLSSFKRDFRRHYRTSPGRWLLERRLARAASLLRTTRLRVTEIMLECGFEELSHFSKAFKERFGHPPSLHRRG